MLIVAFFWAAPAAWTSMWWGWAEWTSRSYPTREDAPSSCGSANTSRTSRARPSGDQHSPRDCITGHRLLKPARRSKTATRDVRSSPLFSAQLPLRKPTPGYPFYSGPSDIQQTTVRPQQPRYRADWPPYSSAAAPTARANSSNPRPRTRTR